MVLALLATALPVLPSGLAVKATAPPARYIPEEVIVLVGHNILYRAYWIGDPDPERALRDASKLKDEQRANHGSGLARALGEEELLDLMEAKAIRDYFKANIRETPAAKLAHPKQR